MMMPVWPVATNGSAGPRALSCRASCSCAVILPTLQSVPTVRMTSASTSLPGRRRPADRRAGGAGRGSAAPLALALAASTGSSPMKVCSPLQISRPRVERLGQPRVPLLGQLATRGAMPMRTASGLRASPSCIDADDRNVPPKPSTPARSSRPAAVEHADHALGEIADDGVGGLGRHRPEVAVGNDEKAWRVHRPGVRRWSKRRSRGVGRHGPRWAARAGSP